MPSFFFLGLCNYKYRATRQCHALLPLTEHITTHSQQTTAFYSVSHYCSAAALEGEKTAPGIKIWMGCSLKGTKNGHFGKQQTVILSEWGLFERSDYSASDDYLKYLFPFYQLSWGNRAEAVARNYVLPVRFSCTAAHKEHTPQLDRSEWRTAQKGGTPPHHPTPLCTCTWPRTVATHRQREFRVDFIISYQSFQQSHGGACVASLR